MVLLMKAGRQHAGQQQVETGIAQHLCPRPVADGRPRRGRIWRHRLPVAGGKPGQHGPEQQDEAGCDDPAEAPADGARQHHLAQRQQRLAGVEAEGCDRYRPTTPGREPAADGGVGQMHHHPLSAEAEQQQARDQLEGMAGGAGQDGAGGKGGQGDGQHPPDRQPVDQPAGQCQQQAAAQGDGGVDQPEITRGQAEIRADVVSRQRHEEGLPEGRGEHRQIAGRIPAGIGAERGEDRRKGHAAGSGVAAGTGTGSLHHSCRKGDG